MISKKYIAIVAAIILVLSATAFYKLSFEAGAQDALSTLNQIGHVQLVHTERVLWVLDALKSGEILPSANNSASKLVNGVFYDYVSMASYLSSEQKASICAAVKSHEVLSILTSDKLTGDYGQIWDQAGVKGLVEMCHETIKR